MLEEESDKIFLDTNLSPFQLEIDWESPPKFDEYPDEEEVVIHEVEENVKDEPMKEIFAEENIVPVAGKIAQAEPMVVEVSTSKTGKHGHAKCHFVAIDIFNGKKLEDIVPSSHNCDVPHVNRTDYQLIDISEDGFVSLLTDNGNTKDDLRLPTDDALLTQIKDGFGEGKDLVVTVMSAMGEEQICALKDIGPKT
ncbi:hypothetical protein RHGRI_021937 [Rhododendron griersonianum]|uniref:Translation initiation factor 5A C-terminal domain-containing protein n=1 Tax=Rhododendron griersonianum TaxID=479676 RepID=A0AAV6JRR9_9ERIC|nr:hypothetical protein RHGRI_021937 [Rhododendron griersonianum]